MMARTARGATRLSFHASMQAALFLKLASMAIKTHRVGQNIEQAICLHIVTTP
jgi:hypothetical protein